MTNISTIAARIVARHAQRAVPIRETSLIALDPQPVFGIAPIRVVSEQRVQAIAFGQLDQPPRFVVSWNPLSRESEGLEPFARALDEYVVEALRAGRLPRVWLPHQAAFEMIDLLGHRYRTNKNASPELRRMGWICRAFAEEAQYSGQQAVAISGDLLRGHMVTGLSPIEEHHLGALLAWIDPPQGVDPLLEAQRRSLIPAAAMLDRPTDDEVERLRRVAKKDVGAAGQAARSMIEALLQAGAAREWDLLLDARHAFWSLGLPAAHLGGLVRQTMDRLGFSLSEDLNPPSQTHSLSRLLYEQELAAERLEDVDIRTDPTSFERARRQGRALTAEVVAVDQPQQNRHPCSITIRTNQEVLRIRRGTQLETRDGAAQGRVRDVREDGAGSTVVELRLKKGVRARTRPEVGESLDWVDSAVYEGSFHRSAIYREMKELALPAVYGQQVPGPVQRSIPPASLGTVADGLRKR